MTMLSIIWNVFAIVGILSVITSVSVIIAGWQSTKYGKNK